MSKVQVWADGFGLWHARVAVSDDRPDWITNARRRARYAIRRELQARTGAPVAPVRLHLAGCTASGGDGMGRVYSIEFAE